MRGGHRGVRALSCTRTLRARGMIHLGRTVGAWRHGGNLPQHTGDKQLVVELYCYKLAWPRQLSELGRESSESECASSQSRVQTRSPLSMRKGAFHRVQNNRVLWVVELSATSTKT